MLASRLARQITTTRYSRLSPEVRRMARLCLLDWLGCTLAGAPRWNHPALLPPGREARIVGKGRTSTGPGAAGANAYSAHLLELDDVHEPSIYHPGAPVIAAALAAAQLEHRSGRKLLEAIVTGYDASIPLGAAVQPEHYRHWHTTGTIGALGAAAASARILRLTPGETETALHLASTQAAGLWRAMIEGQGAKPLHAARAAHNGLAAALLAREGMTCTPCLDGPRGYLQATTGRPIRVNLPRGHPILGVSFKPHASCRFTHSAIDGSLHLRPRIDTGAIREIRVHMAPSALQVVGKEPRDGPSARFSLAWCVAAALQRGRVTPDEFTPRSLRDPRLRGLARKVKLVKDPKAEKLYPRVWPATVEIKAPGGTLRHATTHPLGSPENPMGEGELAEKFMGLTGRREVARQVMGVERVRDVSRLRW